jgi:hypothetical protein
MAVAAFAASARHDGDDGSEAQQGRESLLEAPIEQVACCPGRHVVSAGGRAPMRPCRSD